MKEPIAQGPVDVNVSRLAWMIEMTVAPRPLWFDGEEFTADPNKGLRFHSREVAKKLFDYLHRNKWIKLGYDCYAITEHAWIDADAMRLDWLQEQAEAGCVTMCFELDGGVHVTLDPVGEDQRAAREVNTVRDGIDHLMTANAEFSGTPAALSPEAPLERRVWERCGNCARWGDHPTHDRTMLDWDRAECLIRNCCTNSHDYCDCWLKSPTGRNYQARGKRHNVEFSGGAPLHGAASAGTQS